jgi:hypothetical protein
VTLSSTFLVDSNRPAGAGVLGDIAPGEVRSPEWVFTKPSGALLVGVGNEVGLVAFKEKDPEKPITAPPYPLD